jgi:hypothetical protein
METEGIVEGDPPEISTKFKPSVDEDGLRSAGISSKEIEILVAFRQSAEWAVVKKVLKYHKFQSDVALRNPRSTLDEMRHHQGRIGELNEFTNFVEQDLPEWYNSRAAKKAGRPS